MGLPNAEQARINSKRECIKIIENEIHQAVFKGLFNIVVATAMISQSLETDLKDIGYDLTERSYNTKISWEN